MRASWIASDSIAAFGWRDFTPRDFCPPLHRAAAQERGAGLSLIDRSREIARYFAASVDIFKRASAAPLATNAKCLITPQLPAAAARDFSTSRGRHDAMPAKALRAASRLRRAGTSRVEFHLSLS